MLRRNSSFLFSKLNSGARLNDDGPVRSVGSSGQPNVRDSQPKVSGIRVTQVPVDGLQHHGESRARGAGLWTELRQLLPHARRASKHFVLAAIREPVSKFRDSRAERCGGQLQRQTGGSQTRQQRLEALLRARRFVLVERPSILELYVEYHERR